MRTILLCLVICVALGGCRISDEQHMYLYDDDGCAFVLTREVITGHWHDPWAVDESEYALVRWPLNDKTTCKAPAQNAPVHH